VLRIGDNLFDHFFLFSARNVFLGEAVQSMEVEGLWSLFCNCEFVLGVGLSPLAPSAKGLGMQPLCRRHLRRSGVELTLKVTF
jgi:hypothetical protein